MSLFIEGYICGLDKKFICNINISFHMTIIEVSTNRRKLTTYTVTYNCSGYMSGKQQTSIILLETFTFFMMLTSSRIHIMILYFNNCMIALKRKCSQMFIETPYCLG